MLPNSIGLFRNGFLPTRPNRQRQEIYVGVQFEAKDLNWIVQVDGKPRLFISVFAEKLAKINRERAYVARFMREALNYQRLIVSIKPLPGTELKVPREFIFNDATTADQFINAFPELSVQPFNNMWKEVLEELRTGRSVDAKGKLVDLEQVLDDLPIEGRLRILYLGAAICSIESAGELVNEVERSRLLDTGLNI